MLLLPIGPCLPRRALLVAPSGSAAHRALLGCPVRPCCRPSGRANVDCSDDATRPQRLVLVVVLDCSVRDYEMMRLCVEMRMPITIVSPM
eukprot:1978713-Prymnesium_polylepis.1